MIEISIDLLIRFGRVFIVAVICLFISLLINTWIEIRREPLLK